MKNTNNSIPKEIAEYCINDVVSTENAIQVEKQEALRETLLYKILRGIFELTAVIFVTSVSLMISAAVVMGTFKFVAWLLLFI